MTTSGQWLEQSLEAAGLCFTDPDTSAGGGELKRGLYAVAALLDSRGVAPGSRILVQAESRVQSVIGLLGSACYGAAIPWDGHSVFPLPPDVAGVLCNTRAELPDPLRDLPRIDLPEVEQLTGQTHGHGHDRSLGSPTILLRTSGTSGDPKWVQLEGGSWRCAGKIVGTAVALGPQDQGLCLMPLSHGHGISTGVFAPLASGGRMALADVRSLPDLSWGLGSGVSWYSSSPTVHQTLLRLRGKMPELFDGFRPRVVRSTSDALTRAVKSELEEAFGAPVVEAYAVTEAPGAVASMSLEDRPASRAYPPLPEVSVAIRHDDGTGVRPGEIGRIAVRGENLMAGYLDLATGRLAAREIWHETGDLGHWDGQGRLVIDGRRTDAIKRDGVTLVPADLEEALLAIPLVEEAMVCALAGGERGDQLGIAVVSGDPEADLASLRKLVNTALPPHCRPYKLTRLDTLPRTALGKPSRRALRQLMSEGAGREGAS
jgi:oxalate---CoA ligase